MKTKQKPVSPVVAARRSARAAEKASQPKKPTTLPEGQIDPASMYTRGAMLEQFGLGHKWFRGAQKAGLKITPAGKVKFVRGSDLIEFIASGKGAAVTSQDDHLVGSD